MPNVSKTMLIEGSLPNVTNRRGFLAARMRQVPGACATMSLLLCARHARAENVALRYQAPDSCPPETAFRNEVQVRTPKAVFTQTDAAERLFEVAMSAQDVSVVGKLSIHAPHQPPLERSFEGESCEEVVSALALLTALAIDPDANTSPAKTLLAPVAPPSHPWPVQPPIRLESQPKPKMIQTPPLTWQRGAGVLLGMVGGVAPELLPSAELYGELRTRTNGLGATTFRLGLVSMRNDPLSGSGDPARWTWILVRGQACTLRISLGRGLESESCAGAAVGTIQSKGTQIAVPETRWDAWSEASAVQAIHYSPVRGLQCEVRGGLTIPLTRYEFVYEQPLQAIHHTPWVGWAGQAGLGLQW